MSSKIPEEDVGNFLAAVAGAPFGTFPGNIRAGFERDPAQPGTAQVGIWVDIMEGSKEPYIGRVGQTLTGNTWGSSPGR